MVRAVPPAPAGPEAKTTPIRIEKRWFQGLSAIKLGVAILLLMPFLLFPPILASVGMAPEDVLFIFLVFLPMMAPLMLYILVLVLRTRPGVFEMDPGGVRLYRGGRLVTEIPFGPGVTVGVVFVGYWDDLSPGLSLRAVGVDENEFSLFDRRGHGPLFGYRFRGGGKRLVISRKKGWDIRWIQWMWAPLMFEVDRHGMQMDRSMEKYLQKRRDMGLPVP